MSVLTAPPRPVSSDPTSGGAAPPPSTPRPPGRLARLWRGRPDDPRWVRPALFALLALIGLLYLWDLSASGYANSFYSAAVQAGTKSWTALFFGSLDAGNSITVDKPPASLWVMGLSARLFGFSSWSVLAPQALEGVAAVALLYATVRRWSGPVAGLLAGAALAVTPAAVLMFRFNHPDALLTLLLVGGAYAVTRAIEGASRKWLMLAGAAVGFAFLTKMLQGLLVVPAFALAYLVAAPSALRRRIVDLLAAGVAMVASAGWWVAIVAAWPASSRPYIGGSTNNSVMDLVFGYNGFSRLFGGAGGGGGASGPGGGTATAGSSFGGATGLTRLFGSEMGNEISWLLPAALVTLVVGLWLTRRASRTDRTRAALLLWGGWLVVTGVVFSYMRGIVHPYYTVALAPAIAALVTIGVRMFWQRRHEIIGRAGLGALLASSGGWSVLLLGRDAGWHPALRYLLAALTLGCFAAVLFVPWQRLGRGLLAALVAGSLLAGLGGSTAFALATAGQPHTGSIPSVGPASAATAGGGMGGGPGGGMAGARPTGQLPTGGLAPTANQAPTSGQAPPSGQLPTSGQAPTSGQLPTGAQAGTPSTGGAATGGAPSGGMGGGTTANSALVAKLKTTSSRWAAATVGAQSAAELELASGTSVMAIGGWNGSDPSPTLAQFQQYVVHGEIAYLIAGGQGGGPGGQNGTSSQILAWVQAHYKAVTLGGQTVYDLTSPTS